MKATLMIVTILSLDAAVLQAGIDPIPVASPSGNPTLVSVTRAISGATAIDVFRHPSGLFVDAKRGAFLVADRGNQRIVLFEESGRCRGSISFRDPLKGEALGEPVTMATDATGRLFVVGAGQAEVNVLTSRGSRLGSLESPVPSESRSYPRAVDIGASGSIYVLYGGPLAGVVVMDQAGRIVNGSGLTLGAEPIESALSLAVNEAAGLMVVVSPNSDKQVRVCGLDGRQMNAFGPHGEGAGTLSLASHAAWGPENTIWITDTLRHSIAVFDAQGSYLGRIGGFGRDLGQFNFPVACGFLADGRLIVLERGSARCQVLEVTMVKPDLSVSTLTKHVSATTDIRQSGGDTQ